MRRTAGLIRLALLACGLLLAAACSGHGDGTLAGSATPAPVASPYQEGKQYVTLPPPAGQAAPTGPVVLVEVFSYACPHCAEFAPYMDKLRAELPKGVTVRYKPAIFNEYWMPSAQAFYAARQLGVLEQTHDALFKAHLDHYPLNSLQDMAAWYGHHGVDPQKFIAAATSAETTNLLVADQRTEMGWGIDSTPTLVVGRMADDKPDAAFVAQMRSGDFGSYADLQKLGLWMVEQARKRP